MSKIYNTSGDKLYTFGDRNKYLSRIRKTLYYGKLPKTDCLSLPVTELAAELFSETRQGKSLERLHYYKAADISRNACISPCSLVLALLYLERLKLRNAQYLDKIAPSDLFLVSLMVSCKFLFDDGEGDEVFLDEWANSGNVPIKDLIKFEREFLKAIDWNIFVSESKFYEKLKEIEKILAFKQGNDRNFFTYTELEILASFRDIQKLFYWFLTLTAVLTLTYLTGLITLVGSVYLTSQIPGTSLYIEKMDLSANINAVVPQKMISNSTWGLKNATLEENDSNDERFSWDYWNNPVMDWLARNCGSVSGRRADSLRLDLVLNYLETKWNCLTFMELEDQVHRATKRRLQDQLESSWHAEWIDSIKFGDLY